MARIVENDKGFKVIALSHEEGEALGWGIWHRNDEDTDDLCDFLCMHCNKPIEGELYYVAVLNDVMDEECYNKEKYLSTTVSGISALKRKLVLVLDVIFVTIIVMTLV